MSRTPAQVLTLYRTLLRTARAYPDYNKRDYAVRYIRDEFRANRGETNQEKLKSLFAKAEENLGVLHRQGIIERLYEVEPSVVSWHN